MSAPNAPEAQLLFGLVPFGAAKMVAAFAVSTVGMHFLNKGRNEQDIGKMMRGAFIILAALLLLL